MTASGLGLKKKGAEWRAWPLWGGSTRCTGALNTSLEMTCGMRVNECTALLTWQSSRSDGVLGWACPLIGGAAHSRAWHAALTLPSLGSATPSACLALVSHVHSDGVHLGSHIVPLACSRTRASPLRDERLAGASPAAPWPGWVAAGRAVPCWDPPARCCLPHIPSCWQLPLGGAMRTRACRHRRGSAAATQAPCVGNRRTHHACGTAGRAPLGPGSAG